MAMPRRKRERTYVASAYENAMVAESRRQFARGETTTVTSSSRGSAAARSPYSFEISRRARDALAREECAWETEHGTPRQLRHELASVLEKLCVAPYRGREHENGDPRRRRVFLRRTRFQVVYDVLPDDGSCESSP
jgi:hypothetical protein